MTQTAASETEGAKEMTDRRRRDRSFELFDSSNKAAIDDHLRNFDANNRTQHIFITDAKALRQMQRTLAFYRDLYRLLR